MASKSTHLKLLLFLKRYGPQLFEYFPRGTAVTVAIGKGIAQVPPGALCIGNCTRQHRERGIYVKGCPPVGSSIFRAVSGENPQDDGD